MSTKKVTEIMQFVLDRDIIFGFFKKEKGWQIAFQS
jgi:hypothetical protein